MYRQCLNPATNVINPWFGGVTGPASRPLKAFLAPADSSSPGGVYATLGEPSAGVTNYLVNVECLPAVQQFPAFVADGTSNTIAFAEGRAFGGRGLGSAFAYPVGRHWSGVTYLWFPDRSYFLASYAYPDSRPELLGPAKDADYFRPQCLTSGACQVLLFDGSVRGVTPTIALPNWLAACTAAGGEAIGLDS
jgi:hypothetical protein